MGENGCHGRACIIILRAVSCLDSPWTQGAVPRTRTAVAFSVDFCRRYVVTMSVASHAWSRDYFGGSFSSITIAAPFRWLVGAVCLALLAGQLRKCLPPLEKRSRLKGSARPKVATGMPVIVGACISTDPPT